MGGGGGRESVCEIPEVALVSTCLHISTHSRFERYVYTFYGS